MIFLKLFLVRDKNIFDVTLISSSILGLTDLLQAQQPVVKSPAVVVRSMDLKGKINLLEQNVESLLNQDRNINQEIKEVKSNFATVQAGLTNQIQQISVSCETVRNIPTNLCSFKVYKECSGFKIHVKRHELALKRLYIQTAKLL